MPVEGPGSRPSLQVMARRRVDTSGMSSLSESCMKLKSLGMWTGERMAILV